MALDGKLTLLDIKIELLVELLGGLKPNGDDESEYLQSQRILLSDWLGCTARQS
jgi:hypothetical protein